MKSLRFLVPVLGLAGCFAVGCTDDDPSPAEPHAGAGGQGGSPEPVAGAAGSTEGGAGAAGGCTGDGAGTVVIEVSGLPTDVAPDVFIDGPGDQDYAVDEGGPLEVDGGTYSVTAARVFDTDTTVRTVYDAVVTAPDFCVGDGGSHTVKVEYSAVPSSNKLWMTTGMDDELAGFAAADLGETGVSIDPTVSIDAPGAVSIAFDKDGNLWAVGPIIGEDQLVRIPASELGESGTREPDIRINVKDDVPCFLPFKHIAFDASGNLWVSTNCEETPGIQRINAEDLTSSGDKATDVAFTEVEANEGIAFDKDGNLWVAGGTVLRRFDAVRLDASDIDPPDLTIAVTTATADNSAILGTELAFDKGGNLWGVAGSTIFQLAAADLDQTGEQTVKSNVSFGIDVLALPGTPAFDDGNGLWVALNDGEFGRFSAEQLGESSEPGAPVTPDILISSTSITSTLPVAFYPAPAGLPLYHSIPE
jgi:hypothetical protein